MVVHSAEDFKGLDGKGIFARDLYCPRSVRYQARVVAFLFPDYLIIKELRMPVATECFLLPGYFNIQVTGHMESFFIF